MLFLLYLPPALVATRAAFESIPSRTAIHATMAVFVVAAGLFFPAHPVFALVALLAAVTGTVTLLLVLAVICLEQAAVSFVLSRGGSWCRRSSTHG